MNEQRMSIAAIMDIYPDEWVLIGNPEEVKGELSGIVLLHAKNKKQLVEKAAELSDKSSYSKTILRFTGKLPSTGKWLKFIPSA